MNSIVFEQVSFVGSMASTAAHCPVSPSSTRKREVHNWSSHSALSLYARDDLVQSGYGAVVATRYLSHFKEDRRSRSLPPSRTRQLGWPRL